MGNRKQASLETGPGFCVCLVITEHLPCDKTILGKRGRFPNPEQTVRIDSNDHKHNI